MERIRYAVIKHFGGWDAVCLNEHVRVRIMCMLFYSVLGFVAFLMALINIAAQIYPLLIISVALTVVSWSLAILLFLDKKILKLSISTFFVCGWGLGSYFLYTGGIEGFSILWVLTFFFASHLVMPKTHSRIFSLGLLFGITLCLCTPIHNFLAYEYSAVFRNRFPVVMFASVFFSWIASLIQSETQKRLVKMTENLNHQATTDALTGAYNRTAFRSDFALFNEKAGFSLAILDVDFFKRINDIYSHGTGDIVLRDMVKLICNNIRPDDRVYRWGGEEFVIIYFEMSSEMFTLAVERLRKEVEKHRFCKDISDFPTVTISIGGVSECKTDSMEKCIEKADKCLYEAKKSGRNKAVIAQNATCENVQTNI